MKGARHINHATERVPQLSMNEMQGHHSTSFSAMFHPLHSITNEEQYKKFL